MGVETEVNAKLSNWAKVGAGAELGNKANAQHSWGLGFAELGNSNMQAIALIS